MDYILVLQYLGASIGVGSVAVLSFAPRWVVQSMGVHATSCVFMGAYAALTGQHAILISQMVYLAMDIGGMYVWSKKLKEGLSS